jgi:hypothetical protein
MWWRKLSVQICGWEDEHMGVPSIAGLPIKVVLVGATGDAADWQVPDGTIGSVTIGAVPGVAVLVADETADDSDKSLTVPAGYQYHILSVWVELTTTATVGDRQVVVEAQDDSSDVIGQARAGAVQAASLTRYYQFSPSGQDMLAFRDTDYLSVPLPMWTLPAGYKLRVYDNNAVAAAADDMVVQVLVLREPV